MKQRERRIALIKRNALTGICASRVAVAVPANFVSERAPANVDPYEYPLNGEVMETVRRFVYIFTLKCQQRDMIFQ